MELGVYVPVRVWVGRSSGSYDAHSFPPSYPPQPARLAGGCTAPGLLAGDRTGPGDSGGTLAFTTLHGDAYALWAKISGVGTNRAGNSGRGLPGAPAAGCGHRKSAVAKANSAVSPQRRGVPVTRQVGNSPDTRMRSSSGDCYGRFADRGDIETIRDKFAKFASVRPECGRALPRRP